VLTTDGRTTEMNVWECVSGLVEMEKVGKTMMGEDFG
jgi:hypothetical protein